MRFATKFELAKLEGVKISSPQYITHHMSCSCNVKILPNFAAQKIDNNGEKQQKEELEDLERQLKTTKEELSAYKYAVETCKSPNQP